MTRYYVEITGISDQELEMLGYYRVRQSKYWILYTNKDEAFIVQEQDGKRFIYVEDLNDVIVLRGRRTNAAPSDA